MRNDLTMKRFLILTLGLLAAADLAAATKRPNVLFILTDDQRSDALGGKGASLPREGGRGTPCDTTWPRARRACVGSNGLVDCASSSLRVLTWSGVSP